MTNCLEVDRRRLFVYRISSGLPTYAQNRTVWLANTALIAIRQDSLFNSQSLKDLINGHSEAPTPGIAGR